MFFHGAATPTWKQQQRAAVAAGGIQTWASHQAATAIYGVTAEPEKAEVTVPFKNDLVLADGIVHRTRRLPTHTRVIDGIRVTSLERSLLDYAAVATEFDLECAIEVVLQRHLTTEEKLWMVLVTDGGRGLAGCAQFRRVLENRPEGRPARSVLETLTSRLLRRKNVMGFVRNHRVSVDDENFEIDFAFLAEMVALEVDGKAFHSTRTQTKRDRERQKKLEAAGWHFVRVTWHDVVVRPEWVIEQIALARASNRASN